MPAEAFYPEMPAMPPVPDDTCGYVRKKKSAFRVPRRQKPDPEETGLPLPEGSDNKVPPDTPSSWDPPCQSVNNRRFAAAHNAAAGILHIRIYSRKLPAFPVFPAIPEFLRVLQASAEVFSPHAGDSLPFSRSFPEVKQENRKTP